MKIEINLTAEEVNGIKSYLAEVEGYEKPSVVNTNEVVNEVRIRLYNALRDPREAISHHLNEAESIPTEE